jgi:hypothetical protein
MYVYSHFGHWFKPQLNEEPAEVTVCVVEPWFNEQPTDIAVYVVT